MTKTFRERVLRERMVDTQKYRYVAIPRYGQVLIFRIELAYLGTKAAGAIRYPGNPHGWLRMDP